MSLCRIQQLRQHSTFDYKASCQERLFQGRRRFVLRNHTQIFCLRTRKKAHASAICTCRHALACPCKDERYVMSLPDLVLHTFSQKRKLVFFLPSVRHPPEARDPCLRRSDRQRCAQADGGDGGHQAGIHHLSPQTMQQVHLQHPSEGLCRKYLLPAILHLLQSVPDPPEAWSCQSQEVRPDA